MREIWASLYLLACLSAAAQTTATLTGVVLDPSGQPVAAATVVIRQPVTGLRHETSSGEDGRFRFGNLPLQNYLVTAEKPGFTHAPQEVALRSNVPRDVQLAMTLAEQTTRVEVSAEAGLLVDPQMTGTRTELADEAIDKLPLPPGARGLESVLLSMPGFAANANGAVHPRGAHNQMTYVVDGMPISDQLTGAFANAVDPGIVANLELFTGNVPAEFGNKVSGVAVVTTRTGIGSGRRFAGSVQVAAAQFDQLSQLTQFSGGTDKTGYFASFNTMKSHRFLDQVGLDNLHNGGNSQRAFLRLDRQLAPRTLLRGSLMSGRSSFELANLRSQHAGGQRQRQSLEDVSISTALLHTIDAWSTVETLASFRNAFARLHPSAGDTPVSAHQARRLSTWNLGVRYSRARSSHQFRAGADWQRIPLRENFNFAITDPAFNDPGTEEYLPGLRPFDLTRGGTWFRFAGRAAGTLSSAHASENLRAGRFQLSLGLRYDQYRFLVNDGQWQPRVGLAFNISETGTVLRASYNRTFQTPPNENLLLSNSGSVLSALGGSLIKIRPERQNVYEAGLQQTLGKRASLSGVFFHKDSRNLQDNDNFFNTGIIFPTSLARASVNGAEGRIQLLPVKRVTGSVSFTHYHAVVTPPFTGGLFLGSTVLDDLSSGPFIIDHDQVLGINANVHWEARRSLWFSGQVRYDSGLVSNSSRPEDVARDPDYFDLLPYVNLTSDPTRVRPRTITDLSAGYRRYRVDKLAWETVFQVSNLFDRTALYNFQSIFVGTRVVAPRTASVRFRWFF